MVWRIVVLISCIKLLLINTYKSTDFEVHRNWLAITHSLPISEWYTDNTSEWTLDYPPLFAWFEYILSLVAVYFDPNMLIVKNLNYTSNGTVLFQRLSVMVSDLVLAYGAHRLSVFLSNCQRLRKCSKRNHQWRSRTSVFQILVFANVGLLLVDHIHFQYNGVMLGLLLISISDVLNGNFLAGAFWYTVLLNVKHIYLYMAPAYGIYLLRNYCFTKIGGYTSLPRAIGRIMKLVVIVSLTTFVSFAPFIAEGQLGLVLARLFPFKRGLCHAYWAPNVWAIYNIVDKALLFAGKYLGFEFPNVGIASMTGGLVMDFKHSVLPVITPLLTVILTLLAIMPCIYKLWTSPGNPLHFVRSIILCSSCAFLFGWHVHEKAILLIIIPHSLLAVLWRREAEVYCFLATVGHFTLLPLIFTPAEFLIKTILCILYSCYLFYSVNDLHQGKRDWNGFPLPLLNSLESIYIYGLVIIYCFESFFQGMINDKYPFLALMITSSYCAIGVIYSVVKYYFIFLCMSDDQFKQKTF